jgi:putative flippase GtrA
LTGKFKREFSGFLIIGAVNTANGTIVAYLLSFLLNANASFIIGYGVSLSIAYILNSEFLFKKPLAVSRYAKFVISYVPNFIIQNGIVLIFYNLLGWHRLIVYALAAIIGIPITFLLVKLFAFGKME